MNGTCKTCEKLILIRPILTSISRYWVSYPHQQVLLKEQAFIGYSHVLPNPKTVFLCLILPTTLVSPFTQYAWLGWDPRCYYNGAPSLKNREREIKAISLTHTHPHPHTRSISSLGSDISCSTLVLLASNRKWNSFFWFFPYLLSIHEHSQALVGCGKPELTVRIVQGPFIATFCSATRVRQTATVFVRPRGNSVR